MNYINLTDSLKGNIEFLSTQIQPYLDKYNCKNAFELFNYKFDDPDEKAKVMGYVHRRDAYTQIYNSLEGAQTSIKEEEGQSVIKPIPISRKWEIISNAFTKRASELMKNVSLEDSIVLASPDEEDMDRAEDAMHHYNFEYTIPQLAALWYNQEVEKLSAVWKDSTPDDTGPCDVA